LENLPKISVVFPVDSANDHTVNIKDSGGSRAGIFLLDTGFLPSFYYAFPSSLFFMLEKSPLAVGFSMIKHLAEKILQLC